METASSSDFLITLLLNPVTIIITVIALIFFLVIITLKRKVLPKWILYCIIFLSVIILVFLVFVIYISIQFGSNGARP